MLETSPAGADERRLIPAGDGVRDLQDEIKPEAHDPKEWGIKPSGIISMAMKPPA